MNPFRWTVLRLRAIIGRRALENDMQEEMRAHLERATERLVGRGMSPAGARIEARREFGNVTVLQESARDARGGRWAEALVFDLRFAFRYFARNKATVAIIVAVLALGIGANTVIFSMLQAEFMRPAPAVPEDESHVRMHALEQATRGARWEMAAFSEPEMLALATHTEIFRDVAGWTAHDVVLDAGDSTGARGVGAQFVTPNFFGAVGVPLAGGPGFAQDADAAEMTAVMSFASAELLFGAPLSAVGRNILVNEMPLRIVGVTPPGFQGALRNMDSPALWIPVSARADIARVPRQWLIERSALSLFARLAAGVSHDQAEAIARQVVTRALPDSAARLGMARMAWVRAMHEPAPGSATNEAYLVSTMIGTIGLLILLVACTNVSSLMVAAAVKRRHEIAVRLSLGASRARVLRQLLTESTLLALAGGAAGLLLCWWLLTWLAKREIDGVRIVPDLGTFLFMLALAVGTGILFGLSPALHATRRQVGSALRESGTGATRRSRLQRAFVIAQIVFSQPLLVALGVMLSMVIADYRPLRPVVSERVVKVSFRPLTRTGTPGQRREAVDSLIPRISAQAEVVGVVPEASAFTVRNIVAPALSPGSERPDTTPTTVHLEGAAPGWFAVLDVPVILGRDVSLEDTAGGDWPVVIGSDLARTLWGDGTPIGQTLASPATTPRQDSIRMTVVGVYDATQETTRGNSVSRLYTARNKQWRRDVLLVRTRGTAEPFLPALRRLIRAEAPGLPVSGMRTLAQVDAEERLIALRVAGLAGAGGALALLLASLGLYGVIALAVQQRTREIGIRIAIGADPARVARMFLASGVRVGTTGLLLGLPLSIVGVDLMLSGNEVLIGPQVNAWLIGSGIAVVLLVVASVATWLPARKAALVDPATTLRVE